jgi:hypothetical protein
VAEDLDKLADAATASYERYSQTHGYVNTSVHSYNPPVLAHRCDSNVTVSSFHFQIKEGSSSKFGIDPNDDCVLLEYRPTSPPAK